MVATTDRYATRVGVDTLAAGGNAVDAVVAVSFALAVVNPEAGSVGGGGFMLVRAAEGATAALDYRGTAPRGATRDMFLDARGEPTEASQVGHRAATVPGSVRGLWEAHRRFGTRPWAELVEPAVRLARGFEVGERFVRSFPAHIVAGLERFPASARIFLPGGRPPRVGDAFSQPDLAGTLARIRDGGADGFYLGETADLVVADMERGRGLLRHRDLASYEAVWREALAVPYRGRTILSMPPSSSGGVTLAAACHILGTFPLGSLPWHGDEHVHLLAETWKRAFADRNHYLADPGFAELPLDVLTSPEYGAWRARDIAMGRATPTASVTPGVEAFRGGRAVGEPGRQGGAAGGSTTHVSVVDARGNAASVTTTLNTWYGSKVVAEGTGVLLNNEMDDFSARPGAPNHFGLVQGDANAIAPGKRPLSAMTPSMVLDPAGRLRLVVGTPGGATIITTTFQVVSNVVDFGMGLAEAVCAPRVHHQHLPDRLEAEPGGLDPVTREALTAMGHEVTEREEAWGDVQAILVGEDGALEGVADPRRGGTALGR